MTLGPGGPGRPPRGAAAAFLLLSWICASSCAGPPPSERSRNIVDHAIFDRILADHVRLGRVDYARLKDDPRLGEYIDELAAGHADPAYGRNGRLAFWINAYNAFVLKAVCSRYPIAGIRDIGEVGGTVDGLFRAIRFRVGGESYTLDTIEHKILRPEFRDPRILFALAPGTLGGARLRSSAYHPAAIDTELEEAAGAFVRDPSKVRLIRKERVLELSRLFEWYEEDFGRGPAPVVEFLKRYLSPADASFVTYAEVRIRYLDYDWSLNDAAPEGP